MRIQIGIFGGPREEAVAENSVVLAGVPHSGKTSFLSILYLAMEQGRSTITWGAFQDDREYLNELAARLYSCEEAKHTEVGKAEGMHLSVTLPNAVESMIRIPDLSGETWLELLSERTLSSEQSDHIERADGVCIFVHAGDFGEDPTIASLETSEIGAPGDADESINEEFAGRVTSTQVQVVDLLQVLCETSTRQRTRASIVISAYDLAGDSTPDEWIAMNAPLLEQYLCMNASWLEVRTFGLSAQGGSFSEGADRERLLELDAVDRAFIRDPDGNEADFDEPVLWAIDIA